MLYDPLTVIGIFMLGASAGALVTHIRDKNVLAECRKGLEGSLQSSTAPPMPDSRFALRALIVGRDPEMISVISHLFREKHIEARVCSLESAIGQLSSQKFAALVLDFDELARCPEILKNLPHPNKNVVVFGVASSSAIERSASDVEAAFVIERPLVPSRIRDVLIAEYGRMLRDGQTYFRLAIELPVSIRRASGTMLQCTTLNLSQSGMAVRAAVTFTVGEPIYVAMAIPNTDIFMTIAGKVIWDDKHGKTGFDCTSTPVQVRFFEWLHDHFFTALDSDAVDMSEHASKTNLSSDPVKKAEEHALCG
ncbi:MAG: PilZ domain-containing protein [Candidatus Sulfotelmatobacter sp.]